MRRKLKMGERDRKKRKRQRQRQTETDIERQREQRERDTHTHTHRDTERHRERQRETHREKILFKARSSQYSYENTCVEIRDNKRLQHRWLPVKIAQFLRTAFLTEYLWCLLLQKNLICTYQSFWKLGISKSV